MNSTLNRKNLNKYFYKSIICNQLALDPAKPWFDLTDDQSHKISKEDAKLVDVIHTNGGTLLTVSTLSTEQGRHREF